MTKEEQLKRLRRLTMLGALGLSATTLTACVPTGNKSSSGKSPATSQVEKKDNSVAKKDDKSFDTGAENVKAPQELAVGKWKSSENNLRVEFKKDGKITWRVSPTEFDEGYTLTGTYEISQDEITFNFLPDEVGAVLTDEEKELLDGYYTMHANYKFTSNDKLTLRFTDGSDEIFILTRIK